MGFIGPLIKSCGCYWAIGRVPDKYLGVTIDASEYDKDTGRTIKFKEEEPGTFTEMSGWTYCREHTEKHLKELFEENNK